MTKLGIIEVNLYIKADLTISKEIWVTLKIDVNMRV